MTGWIKYRCSFINQKSPVSLMFALIWVMGMGGSLFSEPVYYFAPSTCSKCRNLYNRLESIKQYDPIFQIYGYDPYTNQGRKEYQIRWSQLQAKNQQDYYVFPAIFVGDTVLTGMDISDSLLLYYFYNRSQKDSDPPPLTDLSWFSVVLLGLGDGINPCAFSVLLFLLSYMSLKHSSRYKIFISAGMFILGNFLFYFIFGVGILRFMKSFIVIIPYFSTGIKLAAISMGIFAGVSIVVKLAKKKVYLSGLSKSDHRKIHKLIKWGQKSFLPLWILVGMLVGFAELICTGQIYFPTLVMIHEFHLTDIVYLLVYNICFVAPLVGVVVFYFFVPNLKIFENLVNRHYSKIMIFISLLLFGLSAYLIFSLY